MGGGKSLRLLSTAYNFSEKNIEYLILKPSIDTRENAPIVKSRVGLERPCTLIDKDDNIFSIVSSYANILESQFQHLLYVLVDEAQFLTSQQVEQLAQIADQLNISVYCYGLKTDFQTYLFEGSKRLFELADEFEEVKSRCECGNKTMVNARFNGDGELVTEGEQIQIGGDETYTAICRKCYFEKLMEKNKEENRGI